MVSIRCANAQSVAKSFFQLANRSYSTTIAQNSTPLEFLIPRCASGASRMTVTASPTRFHNNQTPRSSLNRALNHSAQIQTTRHFATSSARLQTRSILNPQEDDEGNLMMLEITPRAAKRLSQIMAKDENPNLALRIQVESGGCHGFQYLMSLITLPEKGGDKWKEVVNEDDTIFQYLPEEADMKSSSEDGPKIILDEPSLDLLKGSKVDFTMELIGSQFKIVDNPFASSSCGCGTSFDMKI